MVKYILKRLVQLVVVLLGVTFLTFMITQAAPSDAAEMKYVSMGMMPSSELLEKTRKEMGLNDPVLIQYGRWLGNVLHGDLGESSKFGESVWTQMTRKLPMTLKLAGVSLVAVILISFPLGVLSAVKKNKTADYIIRFLSFFGVSMPNFWLALLLMYIFAVRLGWFKVVSTDSIGGMILPVATLTIPMISSYARQIRAGTSGGIECQLCDRCKSQRHTGAQDYLGACAAECHPSDHYTAWLVSGTSAGRCGDY